MFVHHSLFILVFLFFIFWQKSLQEGRMSFGFEFWLTHLKGLCEGFCAKPDWGEEACL